MSQAEKGGHSRRSFLIPATTRTQPSGKIEITKKLLKAEEHKKYEPRQVTAQVTPTSPNEFAVAVVLYMCVCGKMLSTRYSSPRRPSFSKYRVVRASPLVSQKRGFRKFVAGCVSYRVGRFICRRDLQLLYRRFVNVSAQGPRGFAGMCMSLSLPMYYLRPFFYLSLLLIVVNQFRGHMAGYPPPSPLYCSCLHFCREKTSVSSPLVDSRQITTVCVSVTYPEFRPSINSHIAILPKSHTISSNRFLDEAS